MEIDECRALVFFFIQAELFGFNSYTTRFRSSHGFADTDSF